MKKGPKPSKRAFMASLGKPKRLLSALGLAGGLALAATVLPQDALAQATARKPNIVVIFGDDIGTWNVGAYTHGMMGKTPNIDSIAKQGALFTDQYAQPSCTAGRAAFITGQLPVRTGMTTVGLPGSLRGIQKSDPTLAEVLKSLGYATAQFGKNHLGDRNEFLPTMHGFDEWFGNLYHLNAEEEPEQLDYLKDPGLKAKFAPRGVMHTWATTVDDATTDPRFGRVGKQKIENTGPLTRKRMETFDQEVTDATLNYLDRVGKGDKPFFVWFNTTAIHVWSHPQNKYLQQAVEEGRAEQDVVRAKMLEHDAQVGSILKKIKDLGIADNTIVIYTTDNGNELIFWPDGGYAPFRGEKGTTWEGGFRVPLLVRWPGKIPAGQELNGIQSHEDLFVTLAAAAGLPDLKSDLLKGYTMNGTSYKVHLDGYNFVPYLTGQEKKGPRNELFYFNDEAGLTALRFDNWKLVFAEQRAPGTLRVWAGPFTELRMPLMFNLRTDPYERAQITSNTYYDWLLDHAFLLVPAQAYVGQFLTTFKDFPPNQKPASFSIDQVMQKLQEGGGSK